MAAVFCGPACAGSVAGATSNLVQNGLNGQFNLTSLAIDTVGGAVLGKAADVVVEPAISAVSSEVGALIGQTTNQVKGAIGENLPALDLFLRGETVLESPASNGIGKSTYDFLLSNGGFVESKSGTSGLSAPQIQASQLPGVHLEVQYWTYPIVSGIVGSGFASGLAPK